MDLNEIERRFHDLEGQVAYCQSDLHECRNDDIESRLDSIEEVIEKLKKVFVEEPTNDQLEEAKVTRRR